MTISRSGACHFITGDVKATIIDSTHCKTVRDPAPHSSCKQTCVNSLNCQDLAETILKGDKIALTKNFSLIFPRRTHLQCMTSDHSITYTTFRNFFQHTFKSLRVPPAYYLPLYIQLPVLAPTYHYSLRISLSLTHIQVRFRLLRWNL